jgi:hypothetical protein
MTQLLERPKNNFEPSKILGLEPKVLESQVLRLTVVQYEALGQMGLLPRRVELIKGAVNVMSSLGDKQRMNLNNALGQSARLIA